MPESEKITPNINVFDIETTGFSASDEITCFSYRGVQFSQKDHVSEKDLLLDLSALVMKLPDLPIVTFFGEPKYGSTQGFDIPMVRTRYLLNNIPDKYPFRGKKHIDLTEITRKYFYKKVLQEPAPKLLSAPHVVSLVSHCGLFPLKTKEANLQFLEKEMHDPVVFDTVNEFVEANVKLKSEDHNSLDRTFKLFCPGADESLLNEKYSGSDMPILFRKYKETGDKRCLYEILQHNQNCVKKTMYLYNAFIGNDLVNMLSIPTSRL